MSKKILHCRIFACGRSHKRHDSIPPQCVFFLNSAVLYVTIKDN